VTIPGLGRFEQLPPDGGAHLNRTRELHDASSDAAFITGSITRSWREVEIIRTRLPDVSAAGDQVATAVQRIRANEKTC
jgi:hypothetical protein